MCSSRLFSAFMFRFPKFLVFFLGVVVSFVLYEQFLKLDVQYTAHQNFVDNCRFYQGDQARCAYYRQLRENGIVGAEKTYSRDPLRLLFYNVFMLSLIVGLFTVFAAPEKELFLSVISMMPLFFYVSSGSEGWLVPAYVIFIPLFAYLFSELKRFLLSSISGWLT